MPFLFISLKGIYGGSSLARRKTLGLHSSDLLHLLDCDSGDFADVRVRVVRALTKAGTAFAVFGPMAPSA